MADKALAKTVIDQPGIADGAGEAMAAATTQRERRIAAAVEEQQCLLLALDGIVDLLCQLRRDEAAALRCFAAQVDGLDMRHGRAAEALRQHHALIAALARIDLGFDRGRGGGEHDRNLGDMAAHHRHVARMIMHAVVLLVGLVVLLIHHDEPEIGIGQKQRRARADHDRGFSGRNRGPVAGARARGQLRMPFDRPHTEALREPIEELAGERDLRHQDQRLLAPPDDFGHRLEIDLGLAGAGDAVEQRDMKAAARSQGTHGIDGRALLAGELGLRIGWIGRRRRRCVRHRLRRQRALVDQAIDHARGHAGFMRGLALAMQQAIGQHGDHPPPRRCQPLRRRTDESHAKAHALGSEPLAHAQAHPQNHAARRQCIIGDPIDQRPQLTLERRHVQLLRNILQPVVQPRIGIGVLAPDHREHLARTERHADNIAGRKRHPPRHTVGIGLVQRDRNQHIDDSSRCGGMCTDAGSVIHLGTGERLSEG